MKNHSTFDPNAASTSDTGIFGLPYSVNEASLVLLPVPWEVTTSYQAGTVKGPSTILKASRQLDLFDSELGNIYQKGIAILPENRTVTMMNKKYRPIARKIINMGGISHGNASHKKQLDEINAASTKLNTYVYDAVQSLRSQKKIVGLVGGEHSTPFGAMKALLEEYPSMGVLQIDAHADLRKAFEGFEFSHASIMYNLMTKLPCTKLVQVGVRDFCEEEHEIMMNSQGKIVTFFDHEMAKKQAIGTPWLNICNDIVNALPDTIFLSFDIDGLDPSLCPHTGTPVPGGLTFHQATQLIAAIGTSGKTIVGFDLNEVAPGQDEWDGNVGARILWKLCGWALKTHRA